MTANIHQQVNQIVEIKDRATRLDNLIQGYRLCARTEGKSDNTIRIYTTALTTLRDFLEARQYPADVTEIGAPELREFILHLQQVRAFEHHPFNKPTDKGLSGYAVNCYMRAIRAFWSWLVREEIIMSSTFSRVRIPKPPKKVIATFSEEQLNATLRAIDTATSKGFRDWVMLLVLIDTGLRASELVGLTMGNVNLDEGLLKVCGKGNKERVVPIGAKVQRAVWKYINRHRTQPANPIRPTLFLTESGRPMTTDRLRAIVEKYTGRAGVEGVRCSPHTFRHTFAISYLRNGGDVFSLQRILGHSSLEIVRNYVNLAVADVKACHRRFSPADNMGKN
jgi:integrase/recombinase XerD